MLAVIIITYVLVTYCGIITTVNKLRLMLTFYVERVRKKRTVYSPNSVN